MENNPNSEVNNTGNQESPAQVLANMPSFEEHMSNMESYSTSAEQGLETKEQFETPTELRNRFVNEDYGKENLSMPSGLKLNSSDSIQVRLDEANSCVYDIKRVMLDYNSGTSYDKVDKWERADQLQNKMKEYMSEAVTVAEKIKGEWNPAKIAEKYGDSVEKYGVSLADINRALRDSWRAEDPGLVSNGWFINERMQECKSPYEYFATKIDGVIEKHFSENVPEDHKQMISSVVRKMSKEEFPTEGSFTDKEIDFLAKEFSAASKEAGNSFLDAMSLDILHGGSVTNDKLLDGIMYGLYGGTNYGINTVQTKLYDKVEEYMKQE